MAMQARNLVSVVCPVYCEDQVLREFYERATAALEAVEPPIAHELLFVDDGSTDDSLAIMRKLAEEDPRVRVISFSRNFGHQIAITSGMDHAAGDAVIVIDADLQDPPEVMGELIAKWYDGYKVVHGVRTARDGESRFKLLTAGVFYRLLQRLSDTKLPVDSGDFRLLDRQVVDVLRTVREENRYVRGLAAWVGFAQATVEYRRDPRHGGETKYTLGKMLRFAADAVTSFSERPLRVATQLGLFITCCTMVMAGWIAVSRLLEPEQAFPGFAAVMVVVLFLGGVQLLSIGFLGEYVGRIYRETKRRPLYIVEDCINLDTSVHHIRG